MLTEKTLGVGETIRPYTWDCEPGLGIHRRDFLLAAGPLKVPLSINTGEFYPGKVIPGIPGIQVTANAESLCETGLAKQFVYRDGVPYRSFLIPPSAQTLLGRLRLNVRLPRPDVSLVSAPEIHAMRSDAQLQFSFFEQVSGLPLPVFPFDNQRGLYDNPPCFVRVAPDGRMLNTEVRDALAIPVGLDYQSKIEILFTSLEGTDELLTDNGQRGIEGLCKLQVRYQTLRREVRCEVVTAEEIEEMRRQLGKSGPAGDSTFVIECVLSSKAHRAALIEQQIRGYWVS